MARRTTPTHARANARARPATLARVHPSYGWRCACVALFTVLAGAPLLHGASPDPVRTAHGIVGSTSEYASRVGVDILKRGGNAVDAAVASGLLSKAYAARLRAGIRLERRGVPADIVHRLEALGHTMDVLADMGDVHAILIDPTTGLRLGASDPRMDGRTVGY